MINIFKASAGSGKTHTLSKTYLDLLLKADSKTAYRNILAVTFTNKATEEMKERILRDLAEEGKTNPRAREILINLLHDYGSFSVSTIDKFFQQALRAFSRELGSSGNYQIELDKASLTKEAMDRVLDDLTEKDKDLLGWFTKQLETALDNGESFHLESSLYEMAEEFGDVNEKFTYDKKKLTVRFASTPQLGGRRQRRDWPNTQAHRPSTRIASRLRMRRHWPNWPKRQAARLCTH